MLKRGMDIRDTKIHHWSDFHLCYGAFIPFCLFKVALNGRKKKKSKFQEFLNETYSQTITPLELLA